MKFSLAHKILALVLLPLVLSLSILIVLAIMLKQAETAAAHESHAAEVNAETRLIFGYVSNAAKSLTNFVILKQQLYLDVSKDAVFHMQQELPKLRSLISSNRSQAASFQTIEAACTRLSDSLYSAEHDGAALKTQLPEIWQAVRQISAEFKKVSTYESRATYGSFTVDEQSRQQYKNVLIFGAFVNIAVAFFLGVFAVRPIALRLRILTENNLRLANRTALLPPVAGSDEIARLDKSFHAMATALTEHIRMEEATLDNVNDVICSLDRQLKFLRVNRASSAILGFDENELIGKDLRDLLHSTEAEETLSVAAAVVANRSSECFETIVIRKDGAQAALQWTVHWSDVDEALFCVVHDITEIKRLERVKQEFVAMVSHDLRSPLTSLQSSFELVEDGIYGPLTEQGRKAVLSSQRNVSCLIGLINEILDIEKIEAGKFALSQRMARLQSIFDRAYELIRDLADMSQVQIVVEPSFLRAYVDADRLQQVIMNLLGNAIKYSPKDGLVILQAEDRPDENVVKVSVIDQGEGIPTAMREAIFDRFQQVSSTDWKQKGGSGLGLAICKSLIEAHGGAIGVTCADGGGSTFWFTVPSSPPPQAASAEEVQQI